MSTEGDSAMQSPAAIEIVVTEPSITEPALPVPEVALSNGEVMIAQVLSRTKKQAKQLERATKMVEQALDALKKADKERVKHSKQVEQQNKKIDPFAAGAASKAGEKVQGRCKQAPAYGQKER